MLYLEHINMVVSDIPASLEFYKTAFPHWYIRAEGDGDWNGKPRKWLHFGDDYQYLTLNDNGEGGNRDLDGHQTGLAHFAFVISNLDDLVKRMTGAGFPVSKEGADEPWRKNIYFIDPAGFEVEFLEYLTDDPGLRNLPS